METQHNGNLMLLKIIIRCSTNENSSISMEPAKDIYNKRITIYMTTLTTHTLLSVYKIHIAIQTQRTTPPTY